VLWCFVEYFITYDAIKMRGIGYTHKWHSAALSANLPGSIHDDQVHVLHRSRPDFFNQKKPNTVPKGAKMTDK